MFCLIDDFIAMVGQSLAGACHVTQVDVRSNNLDANIGHLFIPIVEKPHFESFSGIPVKKIRDNAITEIDVKGVEGRKLQACGGVILAHCLKSNSSVTVVDASSNNFGVEGGQALADCLKSNTTLATIALSGKGTRKITIHADQLRQNTVETLDYSGQGLHVDGASFIVAELLKSNTSVTKVSACTDLLQNAGNSVCGICGYCIEMAHAGSTLALFFCSH